jgi:NADH-quinone oxidoreductase subunit G
MVRIVINDQEYDVANGSMIIEAADAVNIPIPRFCYHKKLSIAANCRMCLVEVEKVGKPVPACATPVTEGMKVWTSSKIAQDGQKSIMEFLLINHPLDCPICDQAGECELQDISLQYGNDVSRFNEGKRSVKDENFGPLIATEMTRCIHCTRCVRFGKEVAGMREIGATGRGEFMQIGTFIEQNITSEISGNIIDLCPVGALTAKPSQFTARAFELESKLCFSVHDSLASNMALHVRRNEVMRVVPVENEAINEIWLSDRDRYSYQGLLHSDRLRHPMIKKDNKWVSASWVDALDKAVAGLKTVIKASGPQDIATLLSPAATMEESYLLQKFVRALGSNNIDHRLRTTDFSCQQYAPTYPNLGIKFAQIEQQPTIVLIGSNIHKELPLVGIKLIKAVKNGCNIIALNPCKFKYNFNCIQQVVNKNEYAQELASVLKALKINHPLVNNAVVNKSHQEIASILKNSSSGLIALGHLAQTSQNCGEIICLVNLLLANTKLTMGNFNLGANDSAHWLTGAIPHRLPGGEPLSTPGHNAQQMLTQAHKAYILFGIEPELDSAFGIEAIKTIKQAEFVLTISPYISENLLNISDVILPSVPFSETSGTYINLEGAWQTNHAAVNPFGEARPGWKILRVLGNKANLSGFSYQHADEVLAEAKSMLVADNMQLSWQKFELAALSTTESAAIIKYYPLYAMDNIVRRAKALQQTTDAQNTPTITMHLDTAKRYKVDACKQVVVKNQLGQVTMQLKIDSAVSIDTMLIPFNQQTMALGAMHKMVEILPWNG